MDDESSVLVAIARLEGKVDQAIKYGQDHEERLRSIEARPTPDPVTAGRLKALEERRTVSPGQLWGAVAGGLAAAWAFVQILDRVIPMFQQ